MSGVEERIRLIKERIKIAEQGQAQALAERATAEKTAQAAVDEIQKKFGVDNLEDAKTLLASLDDDVAAECTRVEGHLAVAEDSA